MNSMHDIEWGRVWFVSLFVTVICSIISGFNSDYTWGCFLGTFTGNIVWQLFFKKVGENE